MPRKLKTKLKRNEFYCVYPDCTKRVKVADEDMYFEYDKAGKPRLVATDTHGHKLFKYVKWNDADMLQNKY